jgi:hypothetical protein
MNKEKKKHSGLLVSKMYLAPKPYTYCYDEVRISRLNSYSSLFASVLCIAILER